MAINPLQQTGSIAVSVAEGSLLHALEFALDRLKGMLGETQPLPTMPDSTLALFRDPYRFVSRTCAELGRDVFQTRIFLRRTIFLLGQDGAELLYNPELFQRRGAASLRIQRTLFGRGGVQTMDGAAHHRRKEMFMALAGPEQSRALAEEVGDRLRARAQDWAGRDKVDFYREVREVLAEAVCRWAGMPLPDDEVGHRTTQLTALFDQGRLFGPPHWRALWARWQLDHWCESVIEDVRDGRLQAPEGSALAVIAWQRDTSEELLEAREAAVALLNVLRPVVAVSVYAVFIAMALQEHPDCRERIAEGDDVFLQAFVQEVRRFYPFFPMVAARARHSFDWKGYHIGAGTRVMLDLYGTDHDPRLWPSPNAFEPARFLRQEPGSFAFVPQGGGDAYVNHRCPGEGITVELMKVVTRFLVQDLRYDLAQDTSLKLDWRQLPPLPGSRFMLKDAAPASRAG